MFGDPEHDLEERIDGCGSTATHGRVQELIPDPLFRTGVLAPEGVWVVRAELVALNVQSGMFHSNLKELIKERPLRQSSSTTLLSRSRTVMQWLAAGSGEEPGCFGLCPRYDLAFYGRQRCS